jgi:hypothetical protein
MFGKIKDLSGWSHYKKLQAEVQTLKQQLEHKTVVTNQILSDAAIIAEENKQLHQQQSKETTVMAEHGKFVSALEHIGKDFENGLVKAAPVAEMLAGMFPFGGEVKTAIQFTTNAIALAEQTGQTGEQKLAAVTQLAQPVIVPALQKIGKDANNTDVQSFINFLVYAMDNLIPESAVANVKATKN